MNKLKSLVEISRRFQRSVNISADLTEPGQVLAGYELMQSGVNVISSLSDFYCNTEQRAFTITGAFGVGKSALGLFICSLFSNNQEIKDEAWEKLERYPEYPSIKEGLLSNSFDIVVLTGRKGSFAKDLNNAIFGATKYSLKDNIHWYNQTSNRPKLVVLDEMGRYLVGDQFDNCAEFQEFAEAINRKGSRFLFIGILHQNFTAYSAFSPEVQKLEWQKVQGRFTDLPLIAHSEETLKILSEAISVVNSERANREFSNKAIELTTSYLSEHRKINKEEYSTVFKQSWPLNPIVCLILGPLSRRGFWQNNRSVFNFLTSREPFGFQDFLDQTASTSPELYSPDDLWDYLQTNYSAVIASDPVESRNWAVAINCVADSEQLNSEDAVRVVKTVALLTLFGGGSGVKPSNEILRASLPSLSQGRLNKAVQELLYKKLVIEKKHSDSYALFEGSDFDFDKKFQEISINETDPAAVNQIIQFPSIVARKHYVQTGNLRFFRCKVVNRSILDKELASGLKGASGRVLLWLEDDSPQELKDFVGDKIKNLKEINLIGLPANRKEIVSASVEVQKIKKVLEDPILEGDRTARLEVSGLLDAAQERLGFLIEKSFEGAEWLTNTGDFELVPNQRALNKLLSELCDKCYSYGLRLNNELFNRDKLSPNLKPARRNLIFSMLAFPSEDRFGIEGMPPECMAYLSLFMASGMHIKGENGDFHFVLPQKNKSLTKLWSATEKLLDSENPVELNQLYTMWSEPPFGIKYGVMPILLVYFYLLNKNSLTFYQENFYQPELTADLVEYILQRPELVQVKVYKSDARVTKLVDLLYDYLVQEDDRLTDRTPLSVARSLVRKVFSLPKWTLSTNRAGTEAKNFREIILKASDPIKLLFGDLPKAFSENTDTEKTVQKIVESIEELDSLMPRLCSEYRSLLYKELDSEDLDELHSRANSIRRRSGNLQLEAFINQIANLSDSNSDIESIVSLVTGKQGGKWTDLDLVKATTTIVDLSFRFRHLEGLVVSAESEDSSRKLLGIVTAGVAGRQEFIVDVPSKLSERSQKACQTINTLLKGLSREEALVLLIDSIGLLQGNNR